jgi:ABC-type tungstate transport system substrate-binding protein
VLASFRLSFGAAFIAALLNSLFGLILAWVLVRYTFPGRRLVDALIDLPFAMPTAVSGIALCAIFAPNGWIGQWVAPLGIELAYNPIGVVIALTFIGLPFVVRTLQPVLREAESEQEEAAASLGPTAGRPSSGYCGRPWYLRCSPVLPWRLLVAWGSTALSSSLPATSPWCPRLPPDDHESPGGV